MYGSREIVLIDPPDLVDDYLTVRLTTTGRAARVTSRAFDDASRLGEIADRTRVTDLVAWLPEAGDGDALLRRAVEALLPGVVATDGSIVVLADATTPDSGTAWFRDLHAAHPNVQVHVLRHESLAGAFWDCRGELQPLTTQGHVPLPALASAVAEVIARRDPGYSETTLTATQETA